MLEYYLYLLIQSVSAMLLVIWQIDGAQTTRNFYWKTFPVCDYTYGTLLGQRGDVRSLLTCTAECLNKDSCQSLTHDPGARLCKFNNESLVYPNTSDCSGNTVIYAEKQLCVNDNGYPIPMCLPGLPVCKSSSGCTDAVNNVRLCDGGGAGVCDPKQGRVEVFYNDTWGTVCDDYWNDYDYYDYYVDNNDTAYYAFGPDNGDVLCSMLGYTTGTPHDMAAFGEGQDPIWLDNVKCNGTETSLWDCVYNDWGEHDCEHYEDLGVVCS